MEIEVTGKKVTDYKIISDTSFDGLTDNLSTLFPEAKKICIISDKNVYPIYKKEISKVLKSLNAEVSEYIIEPGEGSKNINEVEKVLAFLLDKKLSRNDFILSIGGGVVSDLSGFAASIYKRGIPHVNLPTSLLAMADASIGGKTGIDFGGVKNSVGAFDMPALIYMNLSTLDTLPPREFYAGFAEIMKAALLADAKFYEWLIENMYEICDKDKEVISEMLLRAITIKKTIVEKDPYEKGDRVLLNLGHTIGHAIESFFNGEYIHGECVALGTVAAAFISWKMDMIPMEEYYEIRDMFVPFNLPISISTDDVNPLMDLILNDKKSTSGSINMVLLKRIGKAVLVKDISKELVLQALNELNFDEKE